MNKYLGQTYETFRKASDMYEHRSSLVFMWCVWIVVGITSIGLFVLGLPPRFHQLTLLSARARPALQSCSTGGLCFLLQKLLAVNVYPAFVLVLEILLVTGLLFVGLVLFWRKAGQWEMILFSIAMITYGPYITGSLNALLTVQPQWRLLISLVQTLGIGCAVLSGYLFPDGRFVPGWLRFLALIWIILNLMWLIIPGFPLNFSNPYMLSFPSFFVLMGWLLSTLLAQGYRFRRLANPWQRRQTKWVLLCMTTTILTYGLYYLPRIFFPLLSQSGTPSLLYLLLGVPLFYLSLPLSPVIIFLSMSRYHLFDIETIINRVAVYGTLTLVLAIIYTGSIFALQYLLQFFFQNLAGGSQFAIVGSTLGIAALFQPLRARIQQWIDHRFYRRKYDAAKTLTAFSTTLQTEVDMDKLSKRLSAVIAETMQPTHISLWVFPLVRGEKYAGRPDDPSEREP